MKGSKNISAPATTETAAPSDSPNANQPSPTINGFALTGVSNPPDPAINAYRKDLADVALAGGVIASHYAEPLIRHLIAPTMLFPAPDYDVEPILQLKAGEEIRMLDNSRGWAWGYGPDGRVGYVEAEAVGI